MTDFLLFLIVILLFLIYYELPARSFTEQTMRRVAQALEAIAEKGKQG